MASITLTIPDAQLPRVRAALCAAVGVPDSNANAKQAVIDWVRSTIIQYEHATAAAAIPAPDVAGLVT